MELLMFLLKMTKEGNSLADRHSCINALFEPANNCDITLGVQAVVILSTFRREDHIAALPCS